MKKYALAISFLILAATIYFSFYSLMPQNHSDTSVPPTEFSTERAITHLEKISKKPHYVGSQEHKTVRQYIVNELEKMGLNVEIQNQLIVKESRKSGTRTQNILARIKGSSTGKALLLLSHYDSAPHSSLGASDAGSGVVTILEGIRAFLAEEKQPKNDIIILISDAEELGLFGAQSFVKYHSWAKDVGLVLNFEARGSGGPSYMLVETNGGNKNLIKEFSKANPKYPVATSLMYSIYKMLPNDTDLTVFREDGDIEGFNFAFIDDHFDYHTAQDSYERLDQNTLEHQGSYVMPLLHYFANSDLSNLKSDKEYVYFNFPFIGMIYYPFSWINPFLIFIVACLILLVFYGVSKQKLNLKEVLKGFIPLLVSLISSGLLAYYGWKLLQIIHPQYNDIQHGFSYNGHLYIAAFTALTLSICFMSYKKYFKKDAITNFYISPIFLWIVINVAVAFYLRGAAYFIITGIYSVITLAILLFSKTLVQNKILLLTVLSIPVVLLFAPMIQMFPIGLGLEILYVSTSFVVLLFGLFIPLFSNFKQLKLGRLFLALSILIFIVASFKSSYTKDRKKPNSINYVLDTNKNEAYFTTYSQELDNFTKHYLGENPSKGHYDSIKNSWMTFYKKAPIKDIQLSLISINRDTIIENERFLDFSIIPKRHVSRIILSTKDTVGFTSYIVNGYKFNKKEEENEVFRTLNSGRLLNYYLSDLDSIVNIQFSVEPNEVPKIDFLEISYDLHNNPIFNNKPRSNTMMPFAFTVNDAVMLKKQIDFDKNEP